MFWDLLNIFLVNMVFSLLYGYFLLISLDSLIMDGVNQNIEALFNVERGGKDQGLPQVTPTTVHRSEMGNRISGVIDMALGTTITLTMDQLKFVLNAVVEMALGHKRETPAPPLS